MADNNEAAEVRGDYSIGELRSMLGGETTKEAVPAAKAESGPNSGTDDKSAGKAERGDDGKFKSAKEKEGEGEKKPEPEAGDGPQKRINKAVAKQREAERRAEQLARENEELKKGSGKQPEQKKEAPKAEAQDAKKPEAANFTSYEDYVEALTEWKVEQRERAREAKEAERKRAEASESHKKAWEKKVDAVREKHEDYDDVMEEAGSTPISRAMHNAIAESDIGPELAYYLATNTEEAARIAKLNPYQAAKEMGRIEDKLTEAPADKKPAEDKKPKAEKKELPKPARTVGGGATPKEAKLDDPEMPYLEFKRIAGAHLTRR
jgi:hypothetical protein